MNRFVLLMLMTLISLCQSAFANNYNRGNLVKLCGNSTAHETAVILERNAHRPVVAIGVTMKVKQLPAQVRAVSLDLKMQSLLRNLRTNEEVCLIGYLTRHSDSTDFVLNVDRFGNK